MRGRATAAALGLALLGALLAPLAGAAAASAPLRAGQRLVDTAGALDAVEDEDVRARLETPAASGTDPVVVVREREATPEQALERVEDLQQSWVGATGADQDVAVAVLVDRAPPGGTPRVGVHVGRSLREGALPDDVLRDVVADARAPVRDGDAHRGLVVALGVDAGRPRVERTWSRPTRQRPDALPPALGAALALAGRARSSPPSPP